MPTILGALDIPPPQQSEGQDLNTLLRAEEPEQERAHFTLGYDSHIFSRDERYAMISRSDGSNARLFDLREDPNYEQDIAPDNPDITNSMYEEYVIPDAGGSPPSA